MGSQDEEAKEQVVDEHEDANKTKDKAMDKDEAGLRIWTGGRIRKSLEMRMRTETKITVKTETKLKCTVTGFPPSLAAYGERRTSYS